MDQPINPALATISSRCRCVKIRSLLSMKVFPPCSVYRRKRPCCIPFPQPSQDYLPGPVSPAQTHRCVRAVRIKIKTKTNDSPTTCPVSGVVKERDKERDKEKEEMRNCKKCPMTKSESVELRLVNSMWTIRAGPNKTKTVDRRINKEVYA